MYRKVTVVSIIVLLLSLAFASVSFAQTGTGNQTSQQNQGQGSTPESAFTAPGQGSAASGGRQWYAFQYAGDNSQVQIRLRNAANMVFSVWTQQQIQAAGNNFGATADAVGRSTANAALGGDQYWTGSFNNSGTYYVMVERLQGANADNAAGNYGLEVTGSGVSWRGQGNNSSSNNNASGSNNNAGGSTSTSGSTSGTTSNTGGSTAQGGVAPSTLPTTGGEMASVFPLLIGAMGALSVTAGVLLRRKK